MSERNVICSTNRVSGNYVSKNRPVFTDKKKRKIYRFFPKSKGKKNLIRSKTPKNGKTRQ